MAYIVQKRDMLGSWVDMLVAHAGDDARRYYKQLIEQSGEGSARILQR